MLLNVSGPQLPDDVPEVRFAVTAPGAPAYWARSITGPPRRSSAPARPFRMSSPPMPWRRFGPFVPTSVSSPAEPMTFSMAVEVVGPPTDPLPEEIDDHRRR